MLLSLPQKVLLKSSQRRSPTNRSRYLHCRYGKSIAIAQNSQILLGATPPSFPTVSQPLQYPENPLLKEREDRSGDRKSAFKILIVEDEPIDLQVLINHLSLENYDITQASSGIEAIEIVDRGFKPDLIFRDVMMPQMTGYEVTQQLRKKFPPNELPILLVTAKNQISDIVEGLEFGANDYLTKPINKHELLARLKTHLSLARLNNAYSYFVPRQFLQFLNKESILDVSLGDRVEQEMSVLFSDIRDFTTLSERMTPEDDLKFINSYLWRM